VPYDIVTGEDLARERPTPTQYYEHPLTGERKEFPGLQPTPISVYITLLTSLFLHGSILHIAGNMWFLYIFGDNVEDFLGHALYLGFYLLCGVLASLSHVFATVLLYGVTSHEAEVPSLGASGAISGVMAAYVVLYPRKPVLVFLFRLLMHVPAWVAVGIWFAFQVISGLPMLQGRDSDGVAYAAHVGGFLAGVVLILPFAASRKPPPQVPWSDQPEPGGW
jgi:membrane associated rhomboid family serine protease